MAMIKKRGMVLRLKICYRNQHCFLIGILFIVFVESLFVVDPVEFPGVEEFPEFVERKLFI